VRQALWLATDRDNIINDAYLGLAKPAYGPILEGNLGYSEGPKKATHVSTDEANAILEKSGWTIDPDTNLAIQDRDSGQKQGPATTRIQSGDLEFPAQCQNRTNFISPMGERLAPMLHVVIAHPRICKINTSGRAISTLCSSLKTLELIRIHFLSGIHRISRSGIEFSGFSNATVDKLLTDARQTNDVNVRTKDYAQFQDIITQQIPAIFLDNAVYVYSTPKKEKGFDLQTIIYPSERFLDVKNWYIATKRK
jgi:ABC-type transport system substrate-binding protein